MESNYIDANFMQVKLLSWPTAGKNLSVFSTAVLKNNVLFQRKMIVIRQMTAVSYRNRRYSSDGQTFQQIECTDICHALLFGE